MLIIGAVLVDCGSVMLLQPAGMVFYCFCWACVLLLVLGSSVPQQLAAQQLVCWVFDFEAVVCLEYSCIFQPHCPRLFWFWGV
jgi:hypothetical protein